MAAFRFSGNGRSMYIMKATLNWALWTFQMLIMLVAMALFYWPARLLFAIGRALRDNLGQSLMRGPYYWLAVQRRRLKGEPLWQNHDLVLGILSPEMEKAFADAKPLMGPVAGLDRPLTNAEVAKNLRENVEFFTARAQQFEALPPDEPARNIAV